MLLDAVITIEDPHGSLGRALEPDLAAGKVKQSDISLSHDGVLTRITVSASDVVSMRTGVSAVMNALAVFDKMKEVTSHGHPARH